MDNIDIIYFFLLMLSAAEFSIQIVISTLSEWVKGKFALTQPYNKRLSVFGTKMFWFKLFKYGWFLGIPFIFLIKIHQFFSAMLDCPYCTVFHLAWLANFFILGMTLSQSFLLAPIALVFVAILDKIHS